MLTPATSVEDAARGADVAVLPVGSFEQHGGHLPLITDTVVACLIASRIAQDYDQFLLPPLTIGCSHEHAAEIAADLTRHGVRQLVIVNRHGGNYVLSNVVQEANTSERSMSLYPGRADWEHARQAAGCVTDIHDDMHGGELETLLVQFAYPELVRDTWTTADSHASDRPDFLLLGTAGYTRNRIIGTPSAATPNKGQALLDDLSASFARPLKVLTASASEDA